MRYAMFDSDRKLAGFLLDGINEIPPEAVPITDDFFFEMLAANELNTGFWQLEEDGVTITHQPWPEPEPDPVAEAAKVRDARDVLMRDNYDRGILMVQRAIRMETDPARLVYLNGKVVELDLYAVALQNIPSQQGFPFNIQWPLVPTE